MPLQATPKHVIVATMRDEAVFLVEWLAHHFAAGFDEFHVFTNDCKDGTPHLLAALGEDFPVFGYDNPPPYDEGTIQKQALLRARSIPSVMSADWVFHIDADEFLNVSLGQHQIGDLTSLYPDAQAIAVMWRFFGNSGKAVWNEGRILDEFRLCESAPALERLAFKTIFRPSAFQAFSVHTPKFPVDPDNLRVVNAVGQEMPVANLLTRTGSGYPLSDLSLATWENACLHHYHVRSDDLHLLKHARGDANGRKNIKRKINSDYYCMTNLNEVEDRSIDKLRDRAMVIESLMRARKEVRAIEQRARRRVRKAYAEHAGLETPA